MSNRIPSTALAWAAIAALAGSSGAARASEPLPAMAHGTARAEAPALAPIPAFDASALAERTPLPGGLRGSPLLSAATLSGKRGGTAVANDMQLHGVVADNRVSEATTGSNLITQGALSGAAGVPMVIQNSGNNVLIQNATIINLQLK